MRLLILTILLVVIGAGTVTAVPDYITTVELLDILQRWDPLDIQSTEGLFVAVALWEPNAPDRQPSGSYDIEDQKKDDIPDIQCGCTSEDKGLEGQPALCGMPENSELFVTDITCSQRPYYWLGEDLFIMVRSSQQGHTTISGIYSPLDDNVRIGSYFRKFHSSGNATYIWKTGGSFSGEAGLYLIQPFSGVAGRPIIGKTGEEIKLWIRLEGHNAGVEIINTEIQ